MFLPRALSQQWARYVHGCIAECSWDTRAIYFGNGTELSVEPGFQETSVPSVFVMKNGTNVACLVKDFYPKTVEIQLHPDNNPSEGVVATADGKFSAVKLGQYKKDLDQINCTVWHNNKVVVASYKGSYSNSKISGSPLPKECYKPTAQIEKVNLLSITLLGFRVLLAKSIAVNFVLTIKFFLL
uniref:Immunoglobulin C1-set domain-containing protein n=1 Tax=Monodelphis domestica TaxID=13616 RepID=A0A5F8HDZ0_MONDO